MNSPYLLPYLFFSFQGRIPRSQFWLGTLVLFALQLVILIPLMNNYPEAMAQRPPALWFRNTSLLVDVIFAWPSFALMAKRHYDRNQEPVLAYIGICFMLLFATFDAFGLIQTEGGFTIFGLLLGMPLMALIVALVVELGIRPGTEGPNRYGPDPLQDVA